VIDAMRKVPGRGLKDGAFDFVDGGEIEEVDVGDGNGAGGGESGIMLRVWPTATQPD